MNNEYLQTKIHNQLQADESHVIVKNNRYYYVLTFSDSIGFDWLEAQVRKVAAKVQVDIELYELEPSFDGYFTVVIREVDRRESIDNRQNSLTDYGR